MFDYGQSKIVVYDVYSVLEGNQLTFEEIPIDLTSFYSALGETSPKGFRIADVLFFEPDKYLLIGNGSPMHYGWLTKGEIIPVYGEYPQCIESQNIEEVWSIFGSMSRIKLSDDRTKMVHATFIGAIIQFFAILPAGEIHNYQNRFIYKPEYGIAQGQFQLGSVQTSIRNSDFMTYASLIPLFMASLIARTTRVPLSTLRNLTGTGYRQLNCCRQKIG